MKLYLVNEKPDGSGRWHDIFSESWVMSVENATTFTDREEVDMVASDCGGHVVEFTVGERPTLGATVYLEHLLKDLGVELENPGSVARRDVAQAIRDHLAAKAEPREPDYWLARTEGGDFRRNGGIRSEFTASEWASDYGTPVPVYVGEPPPAPPADPVMADLLETNGRLLAEKDDALEEVSRLSKALDETRLLRETNERLTKQHSAVEEQMNLLRDALGWNGGTLRDAALAVKWLKEALDSREPAPADTPIRCPYCGAAHYPQTVDFCPCPADTPAMVEARRRVGEGWRAHPSIPDWAHHDESERSAPVGKAVVDAMRALRGGK